MSLYGVASMNLDKLRGRHIKRRVLALLIVWIATILLSLLIPPRLERYDLGAAKLITQGDKSIWRFRHTYDLSTTEANNYELVASVLKAQESRQNITEEMLQDMTFLTNHRMQFTIKMYETNTEKTRNQFLAN